MPWRRKWQPNPYFCLEDPMDRGDWWAIVYGVTKNWTWQSEKAPIYQGFPDSSVGKESTCNAGDPGLISGSGRFTGEGPDYPLQYSWASLVSQLVKNLPAMQKTWVLSLVVKMPWRRERLPIPVFWPGEFHGLYSPWRHRVGRDWATCTYICNLTGFLHMQW